MIRVGVLASALAALALFAPAPAAAQSGEGYLAFVEWCRSIGGAHVPGPGYGRCDPGSSSSATDYSEYEAAGQRLGQWLGRQLSGEAARDSRQQRAVALNNQGLATDDPWEKVRLYRESRSLWDRPVIRLNLMYALIDAADEHWYSDVQHSSEQLDRIEQLLNEAEALSGPDLTSFELYPELINSLHLARNRVAQQRAVLASQAANAPALRDASTRISDIAGRIASEIGAGETQGSGGLGFGDPSQPSVTRQTPPPLPPSLAPYQRGVPRLEEVEGSPGYQAWLRGMDAVVRRDWVLAAAWFGTAQLRDPANAAFQRATQISEWTRDFYLRPEARASAALRVPQDQDLALLFPTPSPEQFPDSTPEEVRRRALAGPRGILPEDVDYLFRDSSAQREAMIASVPFEQRRQLAERGVTARANDWTDALAPEMRGMVAELRQALPPRRYGPPNPRATPPDRIDAVTEEMSQSAADEAIVRVLHGDLAAAERALDDPGLAASRGQFQRAIELIQRWRGQASEDAVTGLAPGGSTPRR